MTNLFGEEQSTKKPVNKTERNWKNNFQKWCDEAGQDELSPIGICGYGALCDYCGDNSFGRPCVRALNRYLKENGLQVNYENADFESVWTGEYFEEEK